MTTDAIAGEYHEMRMAARTLGAAQRIAIEREAEYDLAWAKAMLDPENTGKNKEQREAYCTVATWVERGKWDTARSNVRVAEAGLRSARASVAEVELLASLLTSGHDPEELKIA